LIIASVAGLSVELPKSRISVTFGAPTAGLIIVAAKNAAQIAPLRIFVRVRKIMKLSFVVHSRGLARGGVVEYWFSVFSSNNIGF
jgi:hypothetical protein